jgi:hypothetical protein
VTFAAYCVMHVVHAAALQAARRVSLTRDQDIAVYLYLAWFKAERARYVA